MRTFNTATWSDWITNQIMRVIIAVALALPYKQRVRWFGALVEFGVAPLLGYRKRAENQLKFIWPDMNASDRRNLSKRVCNNFGRTMIENYSGADFAAQIDSATMSGAGITALEEAKTKGRPVLFVTGHFGNHEAPRQALALRGYKIGGLYRRMANPYFNAHYETNMLDMSGDVFAQGRKGTVGFMRMLKAGGMGTLLFDVRASRFPQILFMGQPAHTATSVADIALKINALVVPYFGVRQPDGFSFNITIETPIRLTNAPQMMTEITARLEARINANPEQWFWVHRRWG